MQPAHIHRRSGTQEEYDRLCRKLPLSPLRRSPEKWKWVPERNDG